MIKIITLLMLFSFPIFSEEGHHEQVHHEEEGRHDDHGHHGHGGDKAIGPGKAITEVDEHKGFSLSPEATKTLGIETDTFKGSVPEGAMVFSKGEKGVYRFQDGFYQMVDPEELEQGDVVVVKGVKLLRVTDIYSTDKSEYGHAH